MNTNKLKSGKKKMKELRNKEILLKINMYAEISKRGL